MKVFRRVFGFLVLMAICFSAFAQNSQLNQKLLMAVKANRFDSVKILVEQGADVNYRDTNHAPVVMWAALKGDLAMVKYLVSKGADVKSGCSHCDEAGMISGWQKTKWDNRV